MTTQDNEIGTVIREHRKRLGLTMEEMQKRTGINNGNLSKIERGQQSLTNETMKAIASAYGMSLSDLFSARRAQDGIFGKNGAATKTVTHLNVSEFESLDQIPGDQIVVIGNISTSIDAARGGAKVQMDEKHGHLFFGEEINKLHTAPSALGGYVVPNDAMEPRLYSGDTVLVDISDTVVPTTGGVFCVIMDDENIEFRRLMPYPGKGLRIICDNAKYPEAVLDHRQAAAIMIVGRVKVVRSNAGL